MLLVNQLIQLFHLRTIFSIIKHQFQEMNKLLKEQEHVPKLYKKPKFNQLRKILNILALELDLDQLYQ